VALFSSYSSEQMKTLILN